MKKRLLGVLSILCVAAMVLGCIPLATAENAGESRVIIAEWKDEDNYDGLRPKELRMTLSDGSTAVLNEANGWAGEVAGLEAGTYTWTAPEVPGYAVSLDQGDITIVTLTHPVKKTTASVTVQWEDHDNAAGLRPASVQAKLLADGKAYGAPVTLNSGNGWKATWSDLPATGKGTDKEIVYTVESGIVPDGYTLATADATLTYTLMTGTLTIEASVTGAPEGTDPGTIQMTVTGPDKRMPMTLKLSQFTGGKYTISDVIPGAYLVQETNADSLIMDGYILDTAASQTQDAVQVKNGETATLTLKNVYTDEIPEREENEDPTSAYSALTFEILGPDARMPMTITYSQFVNGKFELTELTPGSYVIVERNAGTLVNSYTLDTDSTTGVSLTVSADGKATATLFNHYIPAPTPVPNGETVDIPVTKIWNDNNNQAGNRPVSVTVRLYADGAEVDSHVLTADEGWQFTFTEKPRYNGDTEIVYSVNEDPVAQYTAAIQGTTITNNYQPDLTSVSVRKVWDDDNNATGQRPTSISVTLSNGQTVILNAANGWSATVTNLPAVQNGQPVQYTWSEQEVLGYVQTGITQDGQTTVITNALWVRPQVEDETEIPKTRGDVWYVFEEYETPLGVEITINHVGDCFD